MYNILEVEDKIKGLPDQALMKEAQFPSGDVPQFLIVSELQRRNEMRKSYSAMQEPTQTVPVAQQVVAEAGQGIVGMMGGNPMPMQAQAPMPMAAPMQAQTPMAAPMQSSMPVPMQPRVPVPMQPPMQPPVPQPQTPAGIVGMQTGRTAPNLYDESLFSQRVADVIGQRSESQRRAFKTAEERRKEQEEKGSRRARSIELREQVRRDAFDEGLSIPEANNLANSIYITDDGQVQFPSVLDPNQVPSRTAKLPYTEMLSPYDGIPFGSGNLDVITDPPPSDNPELVGYNSNIMDLTKSGREDISRLRGEINELNIPQASLTEREFIADDIDRQSYIDRLSSIAGEDIASREVLIDELQEKSKKDALSAFLMSFGAGVAGGDLSGGIEQGSKAAQDVKQIADKRLFDERKSMRDVKSAAEREAVQLGLSAEEATLAGRRAEQKFGADQEALRNTVEFQNYTASRQQLLDQIAGAREDVTTIATLIKNEADIINDANRIEADMARERGTERRNIRDYITDAVDAQRETLEASTIGITDPSLITKIVDGYRSLLEKKLGLPSSSVFEQTPVDELFGASEIDTSQFSIDR